MINLARIRLKILKYYLYSKIELEWLKYLYIYVCKCMYKKYVIWVAFKWPRGIDNPTSKYSPLTFSPSDLSGIFGYSRLLLRSWWYSYYLELVRPTCAHADPNWILKVDVDWLFHAMWTSQELSPDDIIITNCYLSIINCTIII